MIIFFISCTIYIAALLFITPYQHNLKTVPLTFVQNFKLIQASLYLGVLLLVIFFITSNYNFLVIDERIFHLLALRNEITVLLPFQIITHSLIHIDLFHLLTNISGIGLASLYERRVGFKRFLSILAIGCIASIPSILFYADTYIIGISGISGGLSGLFAAYIVDRAGLTIKEWLVACLSIAFLILIFSYTQSIEHSPIDYQVDHIGHMLGAVGVIFYCRFKPFHL